MNPHIIGFIATGVGSVLLGPLGLILGIVLWVVMAKTN